MEKADADIAVISEKLIRLHGDVGDMKSILRDLTTAVTKLAVVEERQGQTSLALERAFTALEKLEKRLEEQDRENDTRFKVIEREMPSLIEKRGWMVALILAVIGAVGMAVTKLVFK